ncbi:glycosyltransferase [Pseudoalteromonas umbrosa]|uniref:glycosyltransferase n=1 Tax=Pseudoalteromonas umbrosa TaxID=3048489 RepID=UPI0024C4081E|nr:glycosyltransferase [Pseudoalteromonas sp. B95]MDK1289587.1 glycosyltransferase [Pseudoalteromonas sp. B95]
MSNNDNLVSVYIPSHKRPAELKAAVESVLRQTHSKIELIVVLDGICSESEAFLIEISSTDKRVKYLVNEQAKGACNARNRAISSATGAFVTGLDDDDIMEPDCISEYIKHWDSKFAFICAAYSIFGVNSTRFEERNVEYHFDSLAERNYVGNQIFTETSRLKDVCFDENMTAWQDYDCWFRLAFGVSKPFLKLGKPLYKVNVDPNRARITTGTRTAKGAQQFLAKHIDNLDGKVQFWVFSDLVNRGQKIPLWLVISLLGTSQSKRAFYFMLKHSALGSLVFSFKNLIAKIKS